MTARPRQRLPRAERRTRILDAAARVFAERGYDRAGLDEMAELAGITKPVIYHHFHSKRDLYVALIDLYGGELLAFMGSRAINATSPAARLAAGMSAFLEFVETHPRAWRILFANPPPADPEIVAAQRAAHDRARATIVALLASADVAESDRDPAGDELVTERELAAETIKSAVNGLAAWWYSHRDVPRDHLVYVLMNVMWVGFERFVAGERWEGEAPSGA